MRIDNDNFDRTEFLVNVQSFLSRYKKLHEGLENLTGMGLGLQGFRDAYSYLLLFNKHFAYEPPPQREWWSLRTETAEFTFDYLDVGDFFVLARDDHRLAFKSGRDSIHFLSGSRNDITVVNREETKVRRVQVIGYPD